jgi:hypothetical protein
LFNRSCINSAELAALPELELEELVGELVETGKFHVTV